MNKLEKVPADPKAAHEVAKPKKAEEADRNETAPGELLEGEGNIGLSIMGGGGHA